MLVRPGRRRASKFRGLCCLGGLAGSSPRLLRRPHVPGPRSVIFWTCPQSSPSPVTASPTPEYSTTAFQVPRGGSNPLSSLFPSRPDTESLFSFSPGPSVCLTDPSLAGTPRPGASYGSFPACLHHESHRERKAFLTALTRLLVMIGSLPHRRLTRSQTTLRTLHATADCLSSLSPIVAGAAHLTLGGLRRSPHLLPILYTSA